MIIPWAAAATMALRRASAATAALLERLAGVLPVGADGAERFSLALGDSRVQNLFKLMGDGARQNRGNVR